MPTIQLEFEKLEILRPKERWQLYFLVVTDHPTEPDKMVMGTLPEPIIRVKSRQGNIIYFEPVTADAGVDGLFILEREMPVDRTLRVRVYLRHSRKSKRNLGEILSDLETGLGGDAMGIVTNILGTTTVPWLVVAKKSAHLIGKVLMKIKDRDFGMVSMDEEFGDEFENQTELDRANTFSSGDAHIVWSWSVRE